MPDTRPQESNRKGKPITSDNKFLIDVRAKEVMQKGMDPEYRREERANQERFTLKI